MSDLEGPLTDVLSRELGDGALQVRDVRRLSGGASRETYALEAVRGDGTVERFVLQRDRPGTLRTSGGMGIEAAVVRAAATAGVPVAPIVASAATADELGAPYLIARHVDGETIARRILRDDEYAGARDRLAADLGRAAASVHTIPLDVADLQQPDQVDQYREVLDMLGEPHPAFELGFRWLEANRPPPTRTTVVHGDFRLGNVIVGPDGLRAVLDWELVHAGDPMEDLGWLCVKAWRFGSPRPAAGVGSYDQLLDAYEEASGMEVDRDVVRWWEALGTLKWGVICIMQASSHLTGMARSVELAAIGRRVCENEHDLLLLLP